MWGSLMLWKNVLKNDPEPKPIMEIDVDTININMSPERGTVGEEDFVIIPIPDTQGYSKNYPANFNAQTQWIVDNRDAWNIVYVAHEGDIVMTSSSILEWENANAAITILEKSVSEGFPDGIPYGMVTGNWDVPTTNYNRYFSADRYRDRSYYGGVYSYPNNDNNYMLFSASGMNFIVINLRWKFDNKELNWADKLLQSYSSRLAIIVSHWILNEDGSFGQPGETIYSTLKENPNLFLLLCGHAEAENMRMDTYKGNVVYSLLANYQDRPNGGNGWLRILQFSPANNEIRVKTYSPVLDMWETDSNSEFTLYFNFDKK